MVYEINTNKSRSRVFYGSLVLTILVLMLGFFLGIFFEMMRTNGIAIQYENNEIQALDLKLQNYYYEIMDSSSCVEATRQNFNFADTLYSQGLQLEKYEEANQLTDELSRQKENYVLLKTELWLNSILLKKKCGNQFDTLVYIYENNAQSAAVRAEQDLISNVLGSVKEKQGNKLILIPIAGNLGLQSVDLQMRIYNVTSLPSIIINEKTVFTGFKSEQDILNELSVK